MEFNEDFQELLNFFNESKIQIVDINQKIWKLLDQKIDLNLILAMVIIILTQDEITQESIKDETYFKFLVDILDLKAIGDVLKLRLAINSKITIFFL